MDPYYIRSISSLWVYEPLLYTTGLYYRPPYGLTHIVVLAPTNQTHQLCVAVWTLSLNVRPVLHTTLWLDPHCRFSACQSGPSALCGCVGVWSLSLNDRPVLQTTLWLDPHCCFGTSQSGPSAMCGCMDP